VTDPVDAFAGTLADLLELPAVGAAGRVLLLAMVVLWLAAAWWAWRDAGSRSEDPLLRLVATAGVILATPLLFPLAIVVYLLLRPRSRPSQDRELELRLLALGREAEPDRCPSCGSSVASGWRRCPACGNRLSAPCPACARPARTDWAICAWCAAELPWAGDVRSGDDDAQAAPVAIAVVPGGRAWLPVMAIPGSATPEPPEPDVPVGPENAGTPHGLGGDQIVRRVVHDRPRHRLDRGRWDR
jgi:hypothetical protein